MTPVTIRAYAKINLYLSVGPRRKDGYHALDTVFQEISLHDTLTFSLRPHSLSLKVKGASLSAGSDNLVIRALTLLRRRLRTTKGLHVDLDKRIPMGAGLGGGSSDAAAALWGGWRLWTGRTAPGRTVPAILKSCASQLGADVAFFLAGGRARGRGIGDRLTPLPPLPKRWIVLIQPPVGVATASAYRWLDAEKSRSPLALNSFEAVIFKRLPAIAQAHRRLVARGCTNVLMSGSGSTVYGFVANAGEGRKIVKTIRPRVGRAWLCSTVVRAR